ncbi:MAG: glycosyltransferase family 2 protein [Candidatus Shapirobacteria bacterium]|nr:glycosyltransferase family 2 protein [Candidatus Shapirobacteria bacterium]
MNKAKISVALITYNEEKNLPDCLRSIKWADEIVVVDDSSKDRTREIAKEFGAKVIKTAKKTFFDENKNVAIEACSGDWIFLLDADERVSPELAKEIRKTVNDWSSGLPVAYWLRRKNYFLGRYFKKGGQYPDPVMRLFKKGKAFLPHDSVHKQPKVNGESGWLENDLIHWATPEFSRYLLRERRYSTLEALQMVEDKISFNPFNWLKYLIFRPVRTFFLLFIRHKGFVDSWQGFVFAFFSGLHHPWSFLKYLRMKIKKVNVIKEWK